MILNRHRWITMLLSLSLAATAAAAGPRPGAGPGEVPVRSSGSTLGDGQVSLDEAVARAEKRYDARVVRAEERNEDGRRVYRIRLLSADGRVFEVKVDARTGDVL